MKNKILKNLSYALCAALGLLNFVFFAIPYIAFYYSYDMGEWGGKASSSIGINGYKVMKLWEGGFSGVMSSLMQIIILVVGIAMLAYGVYGLLRGLDIITTDIIPEKLCQKNYARIALYAHAALNVLLLVFLIILCIANSESETEYGYTSSEGIRLSAGIFITLIFAAAAVVAERILPEKLGVSEEDAPQVIYACSVCGKKVKRGVKFCPDCGGAVAEKIKTVTVYACSACGAKAKAGDKFCTVCGGAVVEKIKPVTVYACSACGAKAKASDKFCTVCGGTVVEKTFTPDIND